MKPDYYSLIPTIYGENDDQKRSYLKYLFECLLHLNWLEETPARKEYFMAENEIEYEYGAQKRKYKSSPYTSGVLDVQDILNRKFHTNYNVCFLNRYDNQFHALGWHADDSPEMNPDHPIAVVSLGSEREIWWKYKEMKGVIPPENRQKLENGSLFIMPAGFQKDHLHRIPKNDSPIGTRISLTFRNYAKT